MSDFLPQGYTVPKNEGRYMKLESGENKFRILEKPIFGWEGWKAGTDGKDTPIRFEFNQKPNDASQFREGRINHFWAMPVWNFKTKRVEILQISQKTILSSIENLARSEDWGSPLGYSITVTKEGSTKEDTKYHVAPTPHKEVPVEVASEFALIKEDGFDMTELFRGGDPFKPGTDMRHVSDDDADNEQPQD